MDLNNDTTDPFESLDKLHNTTFQDNKELTINYEKMKTKYKTSIKKITRYELPTIIGFRATQIANGAPVLVEVPDYMTDTLQIAEYEFKQGATPFILKKRVGDTFEFWKLEDLTHNLGHFN
jgi:DNA-directed RNA polymerase subunit K/omega